MNTAYVITLTANAIFEPVCTGVSDCERVQSSDYAELVGIPVAVIGVVGYAAILASLRMRVELTALLSYVAVAFSAYLTWAEVFRIEAFRGERDGLPVIVPWSVA